VTIDDRDASERARAASMAAESAKQSMDLAVKTWKRYQGLYEKTRSPARRWTRSNPAQGGGGGVLEGQGNG
jgi:hypothetical protein